ncbi:unnamed protein product [Paramecium pentaurelia]|uniref:Uncharacterized protein n=1 Tax=Paramecium pentaurelia TaxID=43138 RepID=A0A8S1WI27_9CILI|nr:unnamed protein product [Paramecium pentaurelia]
MKINFELTPNNCVTFYERQQKQLIDYCISDDQTNIFAIYHPRNIIGWRTKDLYKFYNITSTLNELSLICIKNNYICVASFKSSTVIVMNIKQEKEIINLRHRNSNMKYITFSKNSKYLFTINSEKILTIWNFNREEQLSQINLEQNFKYFVINQLSLITTIKLYNKNQRIRKRLNQDQIKDQKIKHLQISLCDHLCLEIVKNFQINVISLHTQKLIRKKQNLMGLSCINFINNNKFFYIIFENGNILLFQTSTMRILGIITNIYNYTNIIVSCFNNKIAILANNLFGLKLWIVQ